MSNKFKFAGAVILATMMSAAPMAASSTANAPGSASNGCVGEIISGVAAGSGLGRGPLGEAIFDQAVEPCQLADKGLPPSGVSVGCVGFEVSESAARSGLGPGPNGRAIFDQLVKPCHLED